MKINLKGCYNILGEMSYYPNKQVHKFNVSIKKSQVIVNIIPSERKIESFYKTDISKKLWDVLQTKIKDARELSKDLQIELSEITHNLSNATKKVLNLIKYCFNQPKLSEELFSVKGIYWSKDEKNWRKLPQLLRAEIYQSFSICLDEETAINIQNYLDSDFKPFLALRNLQSAEKEKNPRNKWIDASIAAELAIKEFLIRFKPEIEPIILGVPSPPIRKLYGSILKTYTKESSPKLKELVKGAEKRNELLHRPEKEKINPVDADKYVKDVEIAIYHLLSFLYPEDLFLKKYKKKIMELNPYKNLKNQAKLK